MFIQPHQSTFFSRDYFDFKVSVIDEFRGELGRTNKTWKLFYIEQKHAHKDITPDQLYDEDAIYYSFKALTSFEFTDDLDKLTIQGGGYHLDWRKNPENPIVHY